MSERPSPADPLRLAGHLLRNRIVATAHGLAAVDDGMPNDADAAYWSRVSRGGPAMVVTGGVQVSAETTLRRRHLGEAWHPWAARGFRKRADPIAAGGSLPVVQLGHLGRETLGAPIFLPFEAPSSVRGPREPVASRVLRTDDVPAIVRSFGVSAANMVEAGYAGVEIHAAHGYLIAQFLSAVVNDRTDRYGGDVVGRTTLLVEIVDEIRSRVPDALLGVRFSVENDAGGLAPADLAEVAAVLAARAPVDYVNISFGNRGYYVRDMATDAPPLAAEVRGLAAAVGAPLLVSSAFRTRDQIAAALDDGAALVGMARPFLADPDVAHKLLTGRERDIRPCVSCNEECRAFEPTAMCTVNPSLGPDGAPRKPARPIRIGPRPLPLARRVAVVGAGPAGLECALTLAAGGRAHVTLHDAADAIGGQLRVAAAASRRHTWDALLDFYRHQLDRAGVRMALGTTVGSADELTGHDAVVWAIGAVESGPTPDPDGVARVGSTDFLLGSAAPRRPVVLDDGFGWWPTVSAVETALARGAEEVTVISAGAGFAGSIPTESRLQLMERLHGAPLRVLPHTAITSVGADRVTTRHNGSSLGVDLTADLLVEVGERRARHVPADGDVPALAIGDCVMPRRVSHALAEGRAAAEALLAHEVVAVTPART
jgi:2,4-dienoyl-CoA reductase (NADPH2)